MHTIRADDQVGRVALAGLRHHNAVFAVNLLDLRAEDQLDLRAPVRVLDLGGETEELLLHVRPVNPPPRRAGILHDLHEVGAVDNNAIFVDLVLWAGVDAARAARVEVHVLQKAGAVRRDGDGGADFREEGRLLEDLPSLLSCDSVEDARGLCGKYLDLDAFPLAQGDREG